ncbi:hypothetical protein CC78DRAFT_384113 [Lojkania enalia]|uniref:Uncharacterized protein n=1 Tax=Lojkania enalia TaxID=147567 RepID=A0A9P4K7K0_9PLEO|nr:hypothetical protein CC78DRAFT_384113 [Didymosphaeria enalia]
MSRLPYLTALSASMPCGRSWRYAGGQYRGALGMGIVVRSEGNSYGTELAENGLQGWIRSAYAQRQSYREACGPWTQTLLLADSHSEADGSANDRALEPQRLWPSPRSTQSAPQPAVARPTYTGEAQAGGLAVISLPGLSVQA